MADERATEIVRDQERLANERGLFEGQWEEVAERVLPRSSQVFFARGLSALSKGQKKTREQYDASAAIALDRYVAVLHSLMTPQSQQWHRLRATDQGLNRIPRVRRWMDAATSELFAHRYASKANFNGQRLESYVSVGAFGTGALFTDWRPAAYGDPGGLRYRAIHLSEVFLRENHQGMVDTIYRRFQLTARQAVQKLKSGEFESLPKKITEAAVGKNPDQLFDFIHCVRPQDEYEAGRHDRRGKPWASVYVAVGDKELVKSDGYWSWPYSVARGATGPGEVYGQSPAMRVLPNIKVLNEQKKTQLKMGHRMVDPVLLAHDDGVVDTFSLRPGTVNAGGVNAQGQKLVQRLDDNVGQLPQLQELMNDERAVINDAFLVTLFQILVESPQMTATEVIERMKEKSLLMAPSLGQFQTEALGPQIERELDLLARAGRLPPMPPEMVEAAGEYEVEYDGPLNRAMRAEELAGFMRLSEVALNVANGTQDPSILDHLDFDRALPEMADAMAVPARWVRLPEEVQKIREGRAQAAQQQQMLEAAPAAASVAKAVMDKQ